MVSCTEPRRFFQHFSFFFVVIPSITGLPALGLSYLYFPKGITMTLNRRHFLKSTLAAAATVTVAGTKSSGRVLGANETIRIGVAGLNGRGGSHVSAFGRMRNVQVTYLIDPDTRTYERRLRSLSG